MRQNRFEQLVSLYLDGEINEKELYWLRREICRSRERKELFEQYRRLHHATCKARLDDTLITCCGERRSHSFSPFYTVGAMAATIVVALTVGWQVGLISPSAAPSFVQDEPAELDVVVVPASSRSKVNLARLDSQVEINFLEEDDPIFSQVNQSSRLINFESPSLISPTFSGYDSGSRLREPNTRYQFINLQQR